MSIKQSEIKRISLNENHVVSVSTIGYEVDGKPVFETAIFGGFWNGKRFRAHSEKDALTSHRAAVGICMPVSG